MRAREHVGRLQARGPWRGQLPLLEVHETRRGLDDVGVAREALQVRLLEQAGAAEGRAGALVAADGLLLLRLAQLVP